MSLESYFQYLTRSRSVLLSRNRNAITTQDIKSVFKEYIDIPISEDDIEDFVKELDPNGQGFISYGTLAHE